MLLVLFQHVAAEALNVPANRIVVRVKRIGGGFGGKETRSVMISTPVAVAANKYMQLFCLQHIN